ncbi:MAG: hypothetical protein MPW15_16760 [Candidatus Manganitrophus sp.]|nr:hypothetical protein [Candidatus Manganitrophus sp.]
MQIPSASFAAGEGIIDRAVVALINLNTTGRGVDHGDGVAAVGDDEFPIHRARAVLGNERLLPGRSADRESRRVGAARRDLDRSIEGKDISIRLWTPLISRVAGVMTIVKSVKVTTSLSESTLLVEVVPPLRVMVFAPGVQSSANASPCQGHGHIGGKRTIHLKGTVSGLVKFGGKAEIIDHGGAFHAAVAINRLEGKSPIKNDFRNGP